MDLNLSQLSKNTESGKYELLDWNPDDVFKGSLPDILLNYI